MSIFLRNKNDFDWFDNRLFSLFGEEKNSKWMKTDISKTENGYLLEAELPGYQKENISISFEKGYLTIKAVKHDDEMSKDENKSYIKKERTCGETTRTYYIGTEVDEENIKASFVNGVLSVTVSKLIAKDENKKVINIE